MKITKVCKYCNFNFSYEKKLHSPPFLYCSSKCRKDANAKKHYLKYRVLKRQKIIKSCLVCRKEFLTFFPIQVCCSSLCRKRVKKKPCACCGFSDVRAIHEHHINRKENSGIMYLCANHHYIYHSIIGWNGVSEHKTRQEVISIIQEAESVLNHI